MKYIQKMVCPNGCNARFIATAHVTQDWYVDALGNFQDVIKECVEVTHAPDCYDTWRCEDCDTDAVAISEPDASACEVKLKLDFKGLLPSFYERILGWIPDGYQINPNKVRVSKHDYDRIFDRLTENYHRLADEMRITISDDEIAAQTAMAMVNGAPGTDSELEDGIVRLLDGYVVKNEDAEQATTPAPHYMGLPIDAACLLSKQELLDHLSENGTDDRAIAELREQQYARFGKELMWRYPLSDGCALGGFIFPVQEGFLWIPYDEIDKERGELLVLENAELMDTAALSLLREDFASYAAELCAALRDAERIVRDHDIKSVGMEAVD